MSISGDATAPRLAVEERRLPGVRIVAARGEVDIATAPVLSRALNDALRDGPEDVVVDLCDVEFIDSTGLAVLLNALRRMTRARRRLRLACGPGAVKRVLEATRLDWTFEVHPTSDDAVNALAPAA